MMSAVSTTSNNLQFIAVVCKKCANQEKLSMRVFATLTDYAGSRVKKKVKQSRPASGGWYHSFIATLFIAILTCSPGMMCSIVRKS